MSQKFTNEATEFIIGTAVVCDTAELVPAVYRPWNYQYGQVMPDWGLSGGGMASGGIVGQRAVVTKRQLEGLPAG